jgi:hypothetical protein
VSLLFVIWDTGVATDHKVHTKTAPIDNVTSHLSLLLFELLAVLSSISASQSRWKRTRQYVERTRHEYGPQASLCVCFCVSNGSIFKVLNEQEEAKQLSSI